MHSQTVLRCSLQQPDKPPAASTPARLASLASAAHFIPPRNSENPSRHCLDEGGPGTAEVQVGMEPTDVANPDYYHKVVDCQWACPAHTNVPEYIRLIAQGRFTDSYWLNRKSNVFPGILGRTCDRPCEPACRRVRVDEDPVAICRLKRVAADLRDPSDDRLPEIPVVKNGKRVALVGAGPASLTVCNDLMPLGYECVIYEKLSKPGGLMRTNIPAFRLPVDVLESEVDMILDMGVEVHYDSPVESMKWLLDEGYDAVFIGTGAPKGKELNLPGREEADANVHIGIEWLESIHFGHITSIGSKVLVIGVGNTAMDCCRTSQRLGAENVKVMARKSRPYFKASPWELEDAEEELVDIMENHSPKSFVVEDGKLVGMQFEIVEWEPDETGRLQKKVLDDVCSSRLTTSFWPLDKTTRFLGSSGIWASSSTSGVCPKWIAPRS